MEGTLKEEGRGRRGCQLEGVRVRGAIASRRDVVEEVMGKGACEKSPVHSKAECFIAAAHDQRTSSSVSRDDCQKSRRGRRWQCEPNEVIAEVRSDEREVESCPQSTPSKGMVVVQVQEGLLNEQLAIGFPKAVVSGSNYFYLATSCTGKNITIQAG